MLLQLLGRVAAGSAQPAARQPAATAPAPRQRQFAVGTRSGWSAHTEVVAAAGLAVAAGLAEGACRGLPGRRRTRWAVRQTGRRHWPAMGAQPLADWFSDLVKQATQPKTLEEALERLDELGRQLEELRRAKESALQRARDSEEEAAQAQALLADKLSAVEARAAEAEQLLETERSRLAEEERLADKLIAAEARAAEAGQRREAGRTEERSAGPQGGSAEPKDLREVEAKDSAEAERLRRVERAKAAFARQLQAEALPVRLKKAELVSKRLAGRVLEGGEAIKLLEARLEAAEALRAEELKAKEEALAEISRVAEQRKAVQSALQEVRGRAQRAEARAEEAEAETKRLEQELGDARNLARASLQEAKELLEQAQKEGVEVEKREQARADKAELRAKQAEEELEEMRSMPTWRILQKRMTEN
mmetsp:Transcript_51572/g.159998  ORF Transcript_51572/g.159998 Transcript_51572/m.159998 type:complete len:421 (+) Transcript_51572:1-1263(+)